MMTPIIGTKLVLALLTLTAMQMTSAMHLPVEQRDDNMAPIWGTPGVPVCEQIKEELADCWLMAAACAIIKCNPAWLTSKVMIASGDATNTVAADFTTYDENLAFHTLLVNWGDDVKGNKFDATNKREAWWPAGIDLAILAMGGEGVTASGKFDSSKGASTDVGLRALTGLNATAEIDYNYTDFWTWLQKADSTPIIVGTISRGTMTLIGHHAYAVMTTRVEGTTNKVTLWNPWDAIEKEHDVDDVYKDINQLGHLTNWDSYTG